MIFMTTLLLAGLAQASPECPIVRKDLSYKTFVEKVLSAAPRSFESEDAFATLLFVSGRDKGLRLLFEKGSAEVRMEVVHAIGSCQLDGFDKLLREAASGDMPAMRKGAVWTFSQFRDGRYANDVERSLHDNDAKVREDAAAFLPHLRPTSEQDLADALADPNPRVRLRTAGALLESGTRCCREIALKLLADENVRGDAIRVLGLFGDAQDLPLLYSIANSEEAKDRFRRRDAQLAIWQNDLLNSRGEDRKQQYFSILAANNEERCRILYFAFKRNRSPEDRGWLKEGRKKYGDAACRWQLDQILGE